MTQAELDKAAEQLADRARIVVAARHLLKLPDITLETALYMVQYFDASIAASNAKPKQDWMTMVDWEGKA